MLPRYLTVQDIAERLSLPRSSAYELAKSLPHVKIGRRVRVKESDLEAYLRQREVRPWSATAALAATSAAAPSYKTRPVYPRKRKPKA